MRWAAVAACIALGALPDAARAQNCTSRPDLCGLTVTSTIEQPDLAHAIDIVIMGDGFLDAYADGGPWQIEADDLIATFKGQTAAGLYGGLAQVYNFHIVDVISATTDVADTDVTDTALGMRSTGSTIISASGGTINLAALNAPDVDVVIAVANSNGGRANANYNSQLTSGGRVRMSKSSGPISHELGHAIFHLADEYLEASYCNQLGETGLVRERNVTADPTCFKWAAVTAGCLEGARYCSTGIFRSASSCLMRAGGDTASCPVCGRTVAEMLLERRTGSDVADPWSALASPVDGSSYAGTMSMSTSLFDDWFTPLEVAFFIDGAYVATVSDASSYASTSVDTNRWADGPHTAYATVTDSAGHSSISLAHSFNIVNTGDTVVPIVQIQSPSDGQTVAGVVWISAAVTNGTADIANTILYIDGVLVAGSSTGYASFAWDTSAIASGAYAISATALDFAQNLGVSTTVNVTVDSGPGSGFSGLWIGPPWPWASVGPAFTVSYNLMGVAGPTDLLFFVDDQLETTLPQVDRAHSAFSLTSFWSTRRRGRSASM